MAEEGYVPSLAGAFLDKIKPEKAPGDNGDAGDIGRELAGGATNLAAAAAAAGPALKELQGLTQGMKDLGIGYSHDVAMGASTGTKSAGIPAPEKTFDSIPRMGL